MKEYLRFLEHVSPRRIPSNPLGGIVTNRLDQHRPQTEAWLRQHGIEYQRLIMSPHRSFADRDRADDAVRKAEAYIADPTIRLFVKSDDHQALEIARLTGRPVLSMARNGLING